MPPGKTGKDGRRSQRVIMSMPVAIYGNDHAGNPFHEATVTTVVNAHGALISLATPVERGQRLMLTNSATEEDQECIVAYLSRSPGDKLEVGVEFTHPAPGFWRIDFPPADWRPIPE